MRLLGLFVLFIVYVSYDVARCKTWQSEKSLWEEAVSRSPQIPRGHLNLGIIYTRENRQDLAFREFKLAQIYSLSVNRIRKHQLMSQAAAESNLAQVYLVTGHFPEAAVMASHAILMYPELRAAWVNRGTAFLALGLCEKARFDYEQAKVETLPTCR